jgi:hypothetical protein
MLHMVLAVEVSECLISNPGGPAYKVPCCALVIALGLQAEAQRVVTSQYDNARTGANLNETTRYSQSL